MGRGADVRAGGVPASDFLPLSSRSARLGVEVQSRRHDLDMLRDVLREVVLLMAADMGMGVVLAILVDVVLRAQQALRLLDRHVRFHPATSHTEFDALRRDPTLDEPPTDGVDGFVSRSESRGDLRRAPVLAKVLRLGVRDVHDVLFDFVQVGLHEADAEGEDHVGLRAAHGGPPAREVRARLMHDVADGGGHGGGAEREGEKGNQTSGERHPGHGGEDTLDHKERHGRRAGVLYMRETRSFPGVDVMFPWSVRHDGEQRCCCLGSICINPANASTYLVH